jgi:hypothetical protein
MAHFIAVCLLAHAVRVTRGYNWAPVDNVLTAAISAGVFPGCAAAVTVPDGSIVLLKGYGTFVYAGQHTPGGNDIADVP